MRIDEILKNKRTLSFEVFPPKKSGTGTRELFYSINELKTLKPDFISVTYGAGGSNARNAAEIAGYIKSVGVEPLAHITGGPSSPQDIDCVCKGLSRLGVENVLCLRGDKPAEYNAEYCKHFPHATDLIKYIEKYGFTAGAACYPEGHVECETLYADLENLKKKGKSVVLISEELQELIGMSDRIILLKDGEISGEFERSEGLSEAKLIQKMI